MLPECIIFDESTAMLDPLGRRDVMSAIEKLNREQGITVIMITHYMEEAAIADRIVVLDDGRLTDSQGRCVDFRNAIVILTSNLGSDVILNGMTAMGELEESARREVEGLLKRSFRPEFLNRLDEIITFTGLKRNEIKKIISLMIKDVNRRLAERNAEVCLTDAAMDRIIEQAYQPEFGARPIRRYIQRNIETMLARELVAGNIQDGARVEIDGTENGFIWKNAWNEL